uniref:excisionase family DNA-binding protein n=1 Tax=Castellaniella ginsengisoli TaxID=546114 RepID=UPI003F656425
MLSIDIEIIGLNRQTSFDYAFTLGYLAVRTGQFCYIQHHMPKRPMAPISDDIALLEDRWLSISEICRYLGVSNDTIYKRIDKHAMPAHRLGRL